MKPEIGDIIKIMDEGNIEIGYISTNHSHKNLVEYKILKTVRKSSDFDEFRHINISSINNIIENFGNVSIEYLMDLYPEDWI